MQSPDPTASTTAIPLRELAQRLGVSRSFAYRLCQPNGPIPVVVVGRRRRVRIADLERYLDGQTVEA